MKKKIVYISGADSFDAAQVRAAFDEVRSTLGLDSDTVLFGVPVDDLIAMGTVESVCDSVDVPKETPETVQEIVEEIPELVKTATKSPVVPILSVLGGKEKEETPVATQEPVAQEIEITESVEITDIDNIDEMLKDDAPTATHEKTLEELLETMTPLREDVQTITVAENSESVSADDSCVDTDADATLASLASEFVDVQDKVPTVKKSSERGKISKLKNILPFKKMKRDDTGIMGDLFGWAGVAANDEEFSIPGFFTNVASKK